MAPKPDLFGSSSKPAVTDSEQSLMAAASTSGGDKLQTNDSSIPHENDDDDDDIFDDASSYASEITDEGNVGSINSMERKESKQAKEKHFHNKKNRQPKGDEKLPVPSRTPSRSSIVSSNMDNPRPFVKLVNFQSLYRSEMYRCPLFTEELEKVVEQWNVRKEILVRLMDEVRHANHLFRVSQDSFHQYSHVMYTIHKDIFLDDQGKRVLSSARQQLLLKERGTSLSRYEKTSKGNACAGTPADRSSGNSIGSCSSRSSGYLDPLFHSFSVLTDTMMKAVSERESNNGKQVAAMEFLDFSEELLTQAEEMLALGNSLVHEMKGSEMDIQNAFCVLEQLASKLKVGRAANNILEEDIILGKPNKKFPSEMEYGGIKADVGDWWMWETLYRAAVKHQEMTWNASYGRLQGLKQSLLFFQKKHQTTLERAVLAVMPEQRELFLTGAKAFDAALKKTASNEVEEGGKADRETIANDFEAGVQQRSSSLLKKKTFHKSAILNRSRSRYDSAIEQANSLRQGETTAKHLSVFPSPVLSALVVQAKVLERWDKSGWLTTVAIFTADKFLHLFDCEDLDIKTLPQTAFASMYPTTASSRVGVHYQGSSQRRSKMATDMKIPTPSMTFNLLTCTVKTYGYSRRSFELRQVDEVISKNDDLPHTSLRFKDFREANQWFCLLQDLPDPEQPPPHSPLTPTTASAAKYKKDQVITTQEQEHALYDDLDAVKTGRKNRKKHIKDKDKNHTTAGSDNDGSDNFEDASEYINSDDEGSQARVKDEPAGDGDMFMDASEVFDDVSTGI